MTDSEQKKQRIIRSKPDTEFFSMPNAAAQNLELPYDALGVLAYLLSKPVDWETTVFDLRRRGDGKGKIYRILSDLERGGYMSKPTKFKDNKTGQWVWTPRNVADIPKFTAPCPTKPDTGHPDTGNKEIKEQSTEDKEQITKRDSPPPKNGGDTPLEFEYGNINSEFKIPIITILDGITYVADRTTHNDIMQLMARCLGVDTQCSEFTTHTLYSINGNPSENIIICLDCGNIEYGIEHSKYWRRGSGTGDDSIELGSDGRLTEKSWRLIEAHPPTPPKPAHVICPECHEKFVPNNDGICKNCGLHREKSETPYERLQALEARATHSSDTCVKNQRKECEAWQGNNLACLECEWEFEYPDDMYQKDIEQAIALGRLQLTAEQAEVLERLVNNDGLPFEMRPLCTLLSDWEYIESVKYHDRKKGIFWQITDTGRAALEEYRKCCDLQQSKDCAGTEHVGALCEVVEDAPTHDMHCAKCGRVVKTVPCSDLCSPETGIHAIDAMLIICSGCHEEKHEQLVCGLCKLPSEGRVCDDCKAIVELSASGKTPKYIPPPFEPKPKAPKKGRAKKGRAKAKLTPHTLMKNALVSAMGLVQDDITTWGEFNKASKLLRSAGATPEDIPGLHSFTNAEARRKNYQWESPVKMAERWPAYKKQCRGREAVETKDVSKPLDASEGVVRSEL